MNKKREILKVGQLRRPTSCVLSRPPDCDAAIATAAAAVTYVQSLSQEVDSGDEGLGLFGFDLSSAKNDFWWLEEEQ